MVPQVSPSPTSPIPQGDPLDDSPMRDIVIIERDAHLLGDFHRASARAMPRSIVSRYATAWAERLDQVNPKGPRNGLFFDIETIEKKQTFFHDAHIGNGSALWTSWHFTCVSPTHRRNPCGPGTCAH